MGTAKGMLAEARKLLGTTEHPMGSNHAPPVTTFYGFDGPWCDMAVSFIAHKSGNAKAVGRFAWTVAHAEFARNKGRWHYGVEGIRPGDIVFFDWDGTQRIRNIDHIGIYEGRRNGAFMTLEGNTEDRFMRRARSSKFIVGYFRPAYDGATALMPGRERPADEILRRGDEGPHVSKLQKDLNTLGAKPKLQVDGEFGPLTEAAVKSFQKRWHLLVDGEAGPYTLGAVRRQLKGAKPPH